MAEKKSFNANSKFVKWFSELNKDSGSVAGGKGANLAEIFNLGVQVPPGFVITAQAYDYFIEQAKIKDKIENLIQKIDFENPADIDIATEKIRELILKSNFPKEMEEEIVEEYENLDTTGFDFKKGSSLEMFSHSPEPTFVAVRSSATTEDLAGASFAGQQESFLNVKGNHELIKNIKKCFASLFTSRATYYRNKKGFQDAHPSLAVVIQKMVDSEKSGVVFSKDPSYKNENIIIEAVWGLGEGIVSGMITPDTYIVSRSLELIDKKISEKKIAITRDSAGGKSVVKLREEKSSHQVLQTHEIKKLADVAMKLEEHYGKPQDIEFAIEGGEVYIVQTRPITTMENRVDLSSQNINAELILSGLGASPGIASGKVKIVKNLADLNKIKKGDILVTEMTNPDMVVTMQRASAIVTDEGGLTSHAAIVSREMGVPAVVGTKEATTKLKEEEIITVDGFNGKVYKGKVAETTQKEILPVTAETKTKLKVIVDLPTFAERASKTDLKKVGLTRIEGIIAESGKHPQYFLKENKIKDYEEVIFNGVKKIAEHFEEVWVRTSDIRSDEFNHLQGAPQEKEANPMLGMHGIRYSLKYLDIFKAELNALKRISHTGKIIGVLLPQVVLVDEVKKTKEVLKEIGFENAKLGVMVETPAAVQMIREIVKEGIQFISFGTNDLTQFILAVDRGNPEAQYLYNEMNPAILYQLEYVIRICKKNNVETSICGQSGSRKEMVKFLVEKGIDSISVNADVAKEIADYIAELEKQIGEEPRKYNPEKKQENFIEKIVEEVKEEVKDLFKEKKGELIPETEENVEIIEESVEEESVEISDDETPEFDEEKIKEIEEVGEILDDKPEFSDELGIFR